VSGLQRFADDRDRNAFGKEPTGAVRPDVSAIHDVAEPALGLYNTVMTTKQIALKTIEQLPENVSWEDIQERINFVVGVHKGLGELDEGKGVPHDKIRGEFAERLTN
jgi:hypothetical protein